jgi:polyhydroxybutyrate depolymerase
VAFAEAVISEMRASHQVDPAKVYAVGYSNGGQLVDGTRDPIVPYSGGQLSWWARRVFRVGGTSLSAPRTAAYFAARNAITQPPVATDLPHHAESGKTSVTRTDYRQDGKPPVTLYTVHGGGHTVPGPHTAPFILGRTSHDLNAADALSDFFGLSSR